MTTETKTQSVRDALNGGDAARIAAAAEYIKLGTVLSPIKAVIAALGATNPVDITTAAVKAAATITGIALKTGENLPAIGKVVALRVGAGGVADAGDRLISDAGGAAAAKGGNVCGVALLSDDGKTLTFEGNVVAFTIEYYPRPAVDGDHRLDLTS
jgi:hypothetical protein